MLACRSNLLVVAGVFCFYIGLNLPYSICMHYRVICMYGYEKARFFSLFLFTLNCRYELMAFLCKTFAFGQV